MKIRDKVAEYILHAFLPSRCPYCGEIILPNTKACTVCQEKIQPVNTVNPLRKSICISPFFYRDIYKKTVLTLKFRKRPYYAAAMSVYMVEALREKADITDIFQLDIVTCVPPSGESYQERGYNPSELLAKGVARHIEIPFQRLLKKVRDTAVQHTLYSAKERQSNLLNAFAVRKNCSAKIQNRTVLLVDDIMTTGATLNECCQTLYRSGAKKVICITYAYVESKG